MNRVAMVTGGARGIGLATAEAFAAEGWEVIIVDRKPGEDVPGAISQREVDVSDPSAVATLFAWFGERWERLDALVNNAALQLCKPLLEMSVQEWDAVMAANLRAIFLMVQSAYPFLRAGQGSIVNVSSVHAVATSVDIAAYAASKGGALALTRAMALEFAVDEVRVNAILPGAVDTAMLRDGLSRGHVAGASMEERLADLGRRTVMGRVGRPEEIAQAILFLADRDRSAFMTGQAMIVDGGATARLSTE